MTSEILTAPHAFAGLRQGHYHAILADPPWHFETWSETNQTRAAGCHYDTMGPGQIAALPVADLVAKNCALFMWCTNPMLPQALWLMEYWGFEYKTVAFVWAKTTRKPHTPPRWHMGLGYWTRANAELCLLGTRGKPVRLARDVRQLVISPRREHSRKPDTVALEIERLVPGPYVELFAREKRRPLFWDYWGNQTDRFNDMLTGAAA